MRILFLRAVGGLLASALAAGLAPAVAQGPETVTPGAAATPEGKVYDPEDIDALRPLLGQVVTVEGTVVRMGQNKRGDIYYLNFTQDYRRSVSLVFFREDGHFPEDSLREFIGKRVRVTALLSAHREQLQFKLKSLDEVQVVGGGS